MINIQELKETLAINKQDMSNNRTLTNEYMIDSLMSELGYNKRKDKTVRRVLDVNTGIDWEVSNFTGPKIAVKVFALDEPFNTDEINTALRYCSTKRYSILMITDGRIMDIKRFHKDTLEYIDVDRIDLEDDVTSHHEEILTAISKDDFNLDIIDAIISSKIISYDKFLEIVKSNVNMLSAKIGECIGDTSEAVIEQIISHIETAILNDNTNSINGGVIDNANDSVIDTDMLSKITEYEGSIQSLNERIAEYEKQIAELVSQLDAKIAKESNNEYDNTSEIIEYKQQIADFIQQIQDLNITISNKQTEIDDLQAEISKLNSIINHEVATADEQAEELLNIIVDDPELPRSYVAVINSELIQFEDLNTFAGRAIQKLYELKTFEASQFIFNGDTFTLIQPGVRNDIIMNNKTYDLDTSSMSEDELLDKLTQVFSRFDDIVFKCKKIGTLKEPEKKLTLIKLDIKDSKDEPEEFTDNEMIPYDNAFSNVEDVFESNNDNRDGSIIFDGSEEVLGFESDDLSESFTDDTIEFNTGTYQVEHLLCAQLKQIDMLIWEQDITFTNIKYIGSSSHTLNINNVNEINSLDELICKAIDAVVALAVINNDTSAVARLKQVDLADANNFVKLYTTEYAKAYRINGTKYVISGVENISQAASVIADITNRLEIDASDIFMYFGAYTNSEQLIADWGYDESDIQLIDTANTCNTSGDIDEVVILKGNMFTNLVITKNSLQAHKHIIRQVDAIKSNYMAQLLNNMQDYTSAMWLIINEATRNGASIDLSMVGNVLGENYRIISNNKSEVNVNHETLETALGVMYISHVDEWQIPHCLIKAHNVLLNNNAIAVKTQISTEALNYYLNEYKVSDPSTCLAIASFTNYIVENIKK